MKLGNTNYKKKQVGRVTRPHFWKFFKDIVVKLTVIMEK